MSIAPGTRLGPYEIVQPIGAGGMGEVYSANDTRLDRAVAIKVLPEHLSNDPALRERFEREARAVSSLNHSHICTLHDVGEHEGVHFLVMEYLDGETLSDRLQRGALPLDKALEIAREIAGALSVAHRTGIVHRDLKPGNVMLTKQGVKLLDFGLAKASPTRRSLGEGGSDAPTQNKPLTDAGTILGTVQYMAPEQLEGKEVDARADLFALGAILFEMVTGRKAFEGESQASLISAIMSTEPPPVSNLQPISPPALDRVVKKCLAKDPDARWHGAFDLGTELEWIPQSGEDAGAPERKVPWLPWALAGLVAGAALLFTSGADPVAPTRHVASFETDLANFNTTWAPGMALSPDGQYLVYRSAPPTQLRVRPIAALTDHMLEGSESARNPFFSPDSRWVAMVTNDRLVKVPIEGGTPQLIGKLPARFLSSWGSWSANGGIVLVTSTGLYRYPVEGGSYEKILETDGRLLQPDWLPDGHHVLVTLQRGARRSIQIVDMESREMHLLIEGASQPRYVDSGFVVYRSGTGTSSELRAIAFDSERLVTTGPPTVVPASVFAIESAGGAYFTVSRGGHLVYAPPGTARQRSLVWVDREGESTQLDVEPSVFLRPSLSPDGRFVAVDTHVGGEMEHDVWLYDVETGSRTRFTVPGHNAAPVWTPDGARVTFASRRPPEADVQSVFWKSTDNATPAELIVQMEFPSYPVSWTPDGRTYVRT